jgi:hypothetical protein
MMISKEIESARRAELSAAPFFPREYNPDMSLRFRRRIRIAPSVHLSLGLHGAGLSVGPRGLHVGLNRRGMYTSAGIPGSGLYAVHHFRVPSDEHATVEGNAAGLVVGILVAVALFIVLMVAANLAR